MSLLETNSAGEAVSLRGILLVDDDAAVRGAVARILRQAGLYVEEAAHAREAVEVATDFRDKIGLVITDVYLPGDKGPELVAELCDLLPNARALYISGFSDEDVARWGIDPAANFLHKPFSNAELIQTVRDLLAV